jgi:hypothetical protein
MNYLKKYYLLVGLFTGLQLYSQTTSYNQFWNEIAFVHPFKEKFASELDLDFSFSNTPENPRLLSTYTQFATIFALHYYYSGKTNFSLFAGYFSNNYVPEIGQREYPELRFSGQAIYFLKKIGYILQSRSRLEYRLIENSMGQLDDVFRLRQRIKYTKPFGRKFIREKTYYGVISDEIFLKSPSTITGSQFFDRNEFTAGFGYAINNNFTVDLLYTFQYLPRSSGDEIYQALQLNITLNNPFQNLKKGISKK